MRRMTTRAVALCALGLAACGGNVVSDAGPNLDAAPDVTTALDADGDAGALDARPDAREDASGASDQAAGGSDGSPDGASATDASPDTGEAVPRDVPVAIAPCGDAPIVGTFCDASSRYGLPSLDGALAHNDGISGYASAADFDRDGTVDLLFTQLPQSHVSLWLRRGGAFDDATAAWGLAAISNATASAAADFDGDGDQDLVLVSPGAAAIQVYPNLGDRFGAAIDVDMGSPHGVSSIVAADLDRDGSLDLIVGADHVPGSCPPYMVGGCPGEFLAYRQSAPLVFTRVQVTLGSRRAIATRPFDWDGDGRDEVLAVSDWGMFDGGNAVLRVTPAPLPEGFALVDASGGTGFDVAVFGMGIATLDADGDDRDEFLVPNIGRNVLLEHHADPATDVAAAFGAGAVGMVIAGQSPTYTFYDPESPVEGPLARFQDAYLEPASPEFPTTKWAPVVYDFDDDGVDDVFLPASGAFPMYPLPERQQATMLRGTGSGFVDVTSQLHLGDRADFDEALAVDIDDDGDLDLVGVRLARPGHDGGPELLRNDASTGNALTVRAHGRGGAADGIGAVVGVRVGSRWRHRTVDGSLSIFGNGPRVARFGLGAATRADELEVRFVSGVTVRQFDVPAGVVVISE